MRRVVYDTHVIVSAALKPGNLKHFPAPALQSGMARTEPLPVCVLVPFQNGGDLDDRPGRIEGKNDAVPTDALAVPPAPLFPVERFHITLKRIVTHLSQAAVEERGLISGEFFELFDGPW